MRRLLPYLRPLFDALPTLAVIAMLAVVGWQAARDGWTGFDRRLAALALVGVLMEAGACMVDLIGTATFEVRTLRSRLGGFVFSLAVTWFLALPAFVLAYLAGTSPLWLALAFVVPRFYSTVLHPTRDPLEQRRVLAYANDRMQSLKLAMLLGMPVFATCAGIVAILRASGAPPSGWIVTAVCAVLVAWLALALAAAWHAWSPAFGRFPVRLLSRAPWSGLFDRLSDEAGRRKAREERRIEWDHALEWQAREAQGARPDPVPAIRTAR
jgi:hypothetical protein